MITDVEEIKDKHGIIWIKKFIIKSQNDVKFKIWVSLSPTQNCQVASIGEFRQFRCLNNINEIKEDLREVMRRGSDAKLWLIDIKERDKDLVESVFPIGSIEMVNPYASSNGSAMILYMVKKLY